MSNTKNTNNKFSFGKWIIILDGLFIWMITILMILSFTDRTKVLEWLWDYVFDNDVYRPLGFILLFELIMFVTTIGYTIRAVRKGYTYSSKEALALAKTQMIMRLVQIPAYVLIFFMGVIGMFLIFTIGISLALFLFDIISITVTGIASVAVYAILADLKMISKKQQLLYSIGGFIYVLDVIAAFLCYKKVKY